MSLKASRPNIVFITADQHRADCFGIEGRKVKTPHLDQLARTGTRFSSCITPCVVCQPARASILTGQLCRTHGVHDNGIDLDPSVGEKGFAGTLAKAGYNTGYFGKAHFSTYHTFEATGAPECLKSSVNYDDSWYGPYMGWDHVELMLVGHNWWLPEKPPAGQHYERWYYADGNGDEKNRLLWENALDTKGAAQVWASKLPVAWHNSTWTANQAIKWLEEQSALQDEASDAGQVPAPFVTWISFPTLIIPSMPQNLGRNYMIQQTSICRSIGQGIWISGLGGTNRFSPQSRRDQKKMLTRGKHTAEFHHKVMNNCEKLSRTPMVRSH